MQRAVCTTEVGCSFFYDQRGIRQGCCASHILFIIFAEILAIKLEQKIINGFSFDKNSVQSKEFKLLSIEMMLHLPLKALIIFYIMLLMMFMNFQKIQV